MAEAMSSLFLSTYSTSMLSWLHACVLDELSDWLGRAVGGREGASAQCSVMASRGMVISSLQFY